MKINAEDVQAVESHLLGRDTEERRKRYTMGAFPRSDKVKDLNERYRWDLWWELPRDVRYAVSDHTPDMTSAHTDTMLRKLIPAL